MMETHALQYLAPLTDAVIAVLLVATIVYAVILDRKLSALRHAKQDMERLVGGLTSALVRAENGLAELKGAAEQTGQNLQKAVGDGSSLADDLVFLIDRAGNLADRLEHGIKEQCRAGGGAPADAGKSATEGVDEATPHTAGRGGKRRNRSPEQNALLEALRGVR